MDAEKLREMASAWLAEDPDPETREELEDILGKGDEAALADRFGGRLEFGTAGLRGLIGAGPNRMNRSVVIRTTAGLAAYLLEHVPDAKERGVVVGYDGRRLSDAAKDDVAAVLAGHGILARVFSDVAPTPLTAFAVSHLGAAGGVMVTASHNPAAYNGYKVYWGNGAQIVPPHDRGIAEAIEGVGELASIPRMSEDEARRLGLREDLGDETIAAYLERVRALSLGGGGRDRVRIAYTAMHGVGGALALRALSAFGFADVHVVRAQMEPDPAFPTVEFPNPEEEGTLDLALELAEETSAGLVLANDPDADRLAVAVRGKDGAMHTLTGNEIGALLASHLIEDDPAKGDRLVITTIVSTPMVGEIARASGVRYEEVLTGFKWIANRAMELEAATGTRFVLGFEEALGYSVDAVCRDKDGVSAAAVFAELAARAAAEGGGVLDRLEALYRRFGLHRSRQQGFTAPGAEGHAKIERTMARLRSEPPERIGGARVVGIRDYHTGTATRADGTQTKLTLPRSNVLAFDLEGDSRVIARPSGTEPKIKFYFDVREPVAASETLEAARERAEERIDRLAGDFAALASS
ncbi:phospho-sugar mutase [Vulgatibacter incomptus]|uniref:Phosphomannomutase n=1 Tax=Vulgatibacter incomptus TaxID=1391653 RepID=A0A0K1PG15_9BACT|nr:phospho-sugar mutase [Vulgatibacter incomptus]AKU92054.1 Phosphomannomutase [Vulgatibacter incomptus]